MEENETSLYVVPTPIGNLGDITLRALEVLKKVDAILAEDTRNTGILLKHYEIRKPLQSHHSFNEHQTVEAVVRRLQKGEKIALVSDAGTPVISDPGFLLVRACREAGLRVECLPGATAFVPALVNTGYPADRFVFEGFLPQKKGRNTRLQQLQAETRTMVFYESPHRLVKTLEQFAQLFGPDRMAAVARELTKLHEENARGTLAELVAHFQSRTVKGEIAVVVTGAPPSKKQKYGQEIDPDQET